MGLITGLIEKRSTLANPEQWMIDWLGGQKSKSGVRVDEFNAMQASAVFACVRVLSETVASLPLPVYRRIQPKGKERVTNHAIYKLIHDQPNPEMTSFTWRETLQAHLSLWGNAYSEIEYNGRAEPKALWPIPPWKMNIDRDKRTKELIYWVENEDGTYRPLSPSQVLHIPGLGFDGIKGKSPIGYAREAVGLSLATEEFGARFFENGTNIGGIAEHPGQLSEQGASNLRKSLNETYGSLGNSHRLMLLEEGMKYQKVGIPPNDAQFLETRKFQKNEIASIFRVPPHMIADLERATFSNIEHQSIDFVVHTMRPWFVRWEQAMKMKLFNRQSTQNMFAEFLIDGLLRGDASARAQFYSTMFNIGVYSRNDIREKENDNPVEGGDTYYVPLNMVPVDQPREQMRSKENRSIEKRQKQKRSASNRNGIAKSFRSIFEDAGRRIVKREKNDIMREAKKQLTQRNVNDFTIWLENYYQSFPEFIERQMMPVIRSLGEAIHRAAAEEIGSEPTITPELEKFMQQYVNAFTARYIGSSQGQINALIDNANPDEALESVEERLNEWEERRPGKIARRETMQASNAIAKTTWSLAGVTTFVWITMGKSCALCDELDGQTVGREQNFVSANETLESDGKDITVYKGIGHPPLHDGCECQIAPE